jgi:5-methylcytosine-specific restriction endonuclease McrA
MAKADRIKASKRKNAYKRKCIRFGVAYEDLNKFEIFERDGYRCYLCGTTVVIHIEDGHPNKATIDHVIPLSKGGGHTEENVKTCCFECNNLKGSFYFKE